MNTQTALVTGGGRGIGAAIVQLMRKEGLRVLAPARAELDLSDNASIEAFLAALSEPVHILVNNAGINPITLLEQATDAQIEQVLQVNLLAPMRLARGIIPGMIQRGGGRILNISSIWAFVAKSQRSLYSAAKTGLNGLTRTLAVELAPFNILVNGVAPGYVNTDLTRQNNPAEALAAICQTIPLGRMAEPEDIAEFVYFLCSERNRYATGQTFLVDGGFSCV